MLQLKNSILKSSPCPFETSLLFLNLQGPCEHSEQCHHTTGGSARKQQNRRKGTTDTEWAEPEPEGPVEHYLVAFLPCLVFTVSISPHFRTLSLTEIPGAFRASGNCPLLDSRGPCDSATEKHAIGLPEIHTGRPKTRPRACENTLLATRTAPRCKQKPGDAGPLTQLVGQWPSGRLDGQWPIRRLGQPAVIRSAGSALVGGGWRWVAPWGGNSGVTTGGGEEQAGQLAPATSLWDRYKFEKILR